MSPPIRSSVFVTAILNEFRRANEEFGLMNFFCHIGEVCNVIIRVLFHKSNSMTALSNNIIDSLCDYHLFENMCTVNN